MSVECKTDSKIEKILDPVNSQSLANADLLEELIPM